MNTTIPEHKTSTEKTSKIENIINGEGLLGILMVGISVSAILVILFG